MRYGGGGLRQGLSEAHPAYRVGFREPAVIYLDRKGQTFVRQVARDSFLPYSRSLISVGRICENHIGLEFSDVFTRQIMIANCMTKKKEDIQILSQLGGSTL